jgi:hypothetical protein
MSDWKPIETAPKSGNLLGWTPRWEYPRVVYWLENQWETMLDHCEPTHWMPLPEPPKKTHYCIQHNWICKEVKDTKLKSFKKYVIFHESDFTDVLCCDQCPFCGEKA